MRPCERMKLRLVGTEVTGKFVHEDDRHALAGLLVVEPDSIVRGEMRHRRFREQGPRQGTGSRRVGITRARGLTAVWDDTRTKDILRRDNSELCENLRDAVSVCLRRRAAASTSGLFDHPTSIPMSKSIALPRRDGEGEPDLVCLREYSIDEELLTVCLGTSAIRHDALGHQQPIDIGAVTETAVRVDCARPGRDRLQWRSASMIAPDKLREL